ncbi:hypothetical protein KC19_2G195400 [Ceratodon purpureus]|uniref:Morc S5 domain-containing protein n=1 Tax=Ceratodon purpureus TaxID=3225 RepID=A0A8T0IZQ5_CERPU|nr:hypothetical protein KC19_2G195400 [Ceratodon purpureus]KAG0587843.1 hypothetical protein KC19_2G195400 [Ceratodon purpureus]
MDAVIIIDSSDDETEPVCRKAPSSSRPAAVHSQQHLVEVNREAPSFSRPAPVTVNCKEEEPGVQDSVALAKRKRKMAFEDSRPAPVTEGGSLCRRFWQAGNYDDHPPKRRKIKQGALEPARVHPKFLHSNATSHTWALGAIAELLDNAVDEVVNGATFCYVDKIINPRDGDAALLIQDDGGGMTPDALRQCMSLGFSEKTGGTTIGQYGNGFKTSTMRLGADVLVLTRKEIDSGSMTQSVGLLSYTFLRKMGHEDIIVPIVDYRLLGPDVRPELRSNLDGWLSNLATITRWSPYSSEEELLAQFDNMGRHGTKVIIFNLWRDDDDDLELDFDTDPQDIRLRPGVISKEKAKKNTFQTSLVDDHISNRFRLSLRVYSSILYLEMPRNFRIILRGKIVEHHNIVDDLKYVQYLKYKPHFGKEKELSHKDVSVVTTVGFTKEAPMVNVHGYSVYHKNRLIMPFWPVINENSSRGRGVVGILEVNFISPAHDKQGFERTAVFIKLETRLKQMTMEYWKTYSHLLGYKPTAKAIHGPKPIGTSSSVPSSVPQIATSAIPETITLEAITTLPPSSPTDDPLANNVEENQGTEGQTRNPNVENDENHARSSSISGPSTPEGSFGNKMSEGSTHMMGLDKVNVEVEGERRPSEGKDDLDQILAEIRVTNNSDQPMPLANREPDSMTIPPQHNDMVDILEQNTILRERCAFFENREEHWKLRFLQLEKEHLVKIAELEKELFALRKVAQMQNLMPTAAHMPQDAQHEQPTPLNSVKPELK